MAIVDLWGKPVQGGGTTLCMKTSKKTLEDPKQNIFYLTNDSVAMVKDAGLKAIQEGIPKEKIVFAEELLHQRTSLKPEQYLNKIIISSKNAAYHSLISHITTVLRAKKNEQYITGFDDEYDYDSFGYNYQDNVAKDRWINGLSRQWDHTICISATNVGGAISDLDWDNVYYPIKVDPDKYLGIRDLEHFAVTEKEIRDFMHNKVLSKRMKTMLAMLASEGIYISSTEKIENQNKMYEVLKDQGIPVNIRNSSYYDDPREATGAFIAKRATPRGVSLPHIHHQMTLYSKGVSQPETLQEKRILGWNKKLPDGNMLVCTKEDWDHTQWSIEVEDKCDLNFLRQPAKDRHAQLGDRFENSTKYVIMPRAKSNGFKGQIEPIPGITEPLYSVPSKEKLPKLDYTFMQEKVFDASTLKQREGIARLSNNPEDYFKLLSFHPQEENLKYAHKSIYIPPRYINEEYVYGERTADHFYIKNLYLPTERSSITTKYVVSIHPNGFYSVWLNKHTNKIDQQSTKLKREELKNIS